MSSEYIIYNNMYYSICFWGKSTMISSCFYHIEHNDSTMILFDVLHSNMVDMVLLNNINHIFILVILW